jgi:hypothetical protein
MHAPRLFSRAVLFGTLLLIAGCDRSPTRYAKQVAEVSPSGWTVSASSNCIVLRRDATVWVMGKIAKQAPFPDESVEHYFKRAGYETDCEIRLRFVPLLPRSEYEKLKMARQQAAARLSKGASGKDEYTQLQRQYEKCQVPVFLTKDYSIFVDQWAEPLFIDVYPPEAASEAEAFIKNLSKVFKQYENP